MGSYINPVNQTKEEFLMENGECISFSDLPKFENVPFGKMLVCLVNNGPFTAAGIILDQGEYDAFSRTTDPRPKLWFLVDKDLLLDENVSDVKFYL